MKQGCSGPDLGTYFYFLWYLVSLGVLRDATENLRPELKERTFDGVHHMREVSVGGPSCVEERTFRSHLLVTCPDPLMVFSSVVCFCISEFMALKAVAP